MNKFDDSDDTRLMKQLQNEVRAIQDASACPEVVFFYGITFHEVTNIWWVHLFCQVFWGLK